MVVIIIVAVVVVVMVVAVIVVILLETLPLLLTHRISRILCRNLKFIVIEIQLQN